MYENLLITIRFWTKVVYDKVICVSMEKAPHDMAVGLYGFGERFVRSLMDRWHRVWKGLRWCLMLSDTAP